MSMVNISDTIDHQGNEREGMVMSSTPNPVKSYGEQRDAEDWIASSVVSAHLT
ncbi:MAG: hypothetical protein AAGD25_32155 [Cyanobacteria bacterium P01_F01_bin.150]